MTPDFTIDIIRQPSEGYESGGYLSIVTDKDGRRRNYPICHPSKEEALTSVVSEVLSVWDENSRADINIKIKYSESGT